MSELIREALTHDGRDVEILIEVDDAGSQPVDREAVAREQDFGRSRSDIVESRKPFSRGMELIRTCAEEVAETLEAIQEAARPDTVEVELGVKFDSRMGAFIAKTGLGANLKVTLKWATKEKA